METHFGANFAPSHTGASLGWLGAAGIQSLHDPLWLSQITLRRPASLSVCGFIRLF